MITEHDKLVEDMLHAYFISPYPSGPRQAMRAALAIAVERCAAIADEHHGWIEDGQIATAIRALASIKQEPTCGETVRVCDCYLRNPLACQCPPKASQEGT